MPPDCGFSSSRGGGYKGDPEFLAGIPDEWTEQAVLDLILWPMKDPSAPYTAWGYRRAPAAVRCFMNGGRAVPRLTEHVGLAGERMRQKCKSGRLAYMPTVF